MKKIKKIIEYGLYVLAFLLPVQTRLIIKGGELNEGYFEYKTISLYAIDILLIFLIINFTIYKFWQYKFKEQEDEMGEDEIVNAEKMNMGFEQMQNSKCKIQNYWWIIAGLDLIVFISIFFAYDKFLAVYRYGVFLLGIGLLWLIADADYKKIKLLFSFLLGIFLQASLGVWQFITQSSFANKWLGLAKHNAEDLGTSVIEVISSIDGIPERWLRAYGGADHPNILGGLLVVGILLIVYMIIDKSIDKNFSIFNVQFSNKFQKQILWFLIIIFFAGIFFSFSRAAWLALIAGLAIILFNFLKNKKLLEQRQLLEIILVFGIIFFILFSQYKDLVVIRISSNTRLETKSSAERVDSYKSSLQLVKQDWITGVGVGNYTLAMKNNIRSDQSSWYYQPVHNTYLLVFSEIGIIGLIIFIVLLCYIILKTLKQENIFKLSIIISAMIMMLFDHWWWSLHFGVLFFFFFIGIMLENNKKIV